MKRPRLVLIFILLVTTAALLIDWPRVPVKFNLGPIKVNQVFAGPSLDFNLFGFRFQRDLDVKLGLDLQGGTDLTLRADMGGIPEDQKDEALEAAREVIERRVNLYGVAEAVIQTSKVGGDHRIIVQLPGVKNIEEAKNLVGQTAKLEFREFIKEEDANSFAVAQVPPATLENTKETGVSGKDLKNARVDIAPGASGQGPSEPVVAFELKSESAGKFGELTKRLLQKPLLIFLDDQFVSGPTVNSQITNEGQITLGQGAPAAAARQLATQLKAGALPVKKIDIISERTVGATLGQESVNRSLVAGLVGLAVVGVFMIFFYHIPGILAVAALGIYTLISLALFKLVPVTLTLAGIAGFILSIGMAVDANILIFERMKEELRAGRTRKQAIEIGFSRAWNSIRDSNVSSLLTTAILFYFGTGQVRGFALTLALGILVSMFTAIMVTRNFLRFVYKE